MQVEKDMCAEQAFDLLSCLGTDMLQSRAAFADHDAFLALALDVDGDVNVDEVLVVALNHLVDRDRNRVRQLFPYAVECSFPNELGDHHGVRLIGELSVGIERLPFGKLRGHQLHQDVELESRRSRHGHNVGPVAESVDRGELGSELVGAREVGLGDDSEFRRTGDLGELGREETITGTHGFVGRHAEGDDVDGRPACAYDVVQPLAEQRARTVQPGCVNDDELRVRAVDDAAHRVPGGLRVWARYGDLVTDERVGEGGLADVRTADDAGETAFHPVRTWRVGLPMSASNAWSWSSTSAASVTTTAASNFDEPLETAAATAACSAVKVRDGRVTLAAA